jgi:hypothetical protein
VSALNNRTDVYNLLLGNEILGKQAVARSRNNRTAVLQNPFLGNGLINTLPLITQQKRVFYAVRAEELSWTPSALVFQFLSECGDSQLVTSQFSEEYPAVYLKLFKWK